MVLRGMFSQAVSKLEAFVKKAGSVLTMASPLVLYGLRLSASVILALNREFPGKVTRIADALQSGTRTLLTEIDIPNPDGALPPGIYCSVELKVPRKTLSFIIPFASGGCQGRQGRDPQRQGHTRLGHAGASGRGSKRGRARDPQSASQLDRWRQGTAAP
jgi:hypothetical protein